MGPSHPGRSPAHTCPNLRITAACGGAAWGDSPGLATLLPFSMHHSCPRTSHLAGGPICSPDTSSDPKASRRGPEGPAAEHSPSEGSGMPFQISCRLFRQLINPVFYTHGLLISLLAIVHLVSMHFRLWESACSSEPGSLGLRQVMQSQL